MVVVEGLVEDRAEHVLEVDATEPSGGKLTQITRRFLQQNCFINQLLLVTNANYQPTIVLSTIYHNRG